MTIRVLFAALVLLMMCCPESIRTALTGTAQADTTTVEAVVKESEGPVDFARDISPILSNNCYFCHGPDGSHRKAGLRLDDREEAIDFAAIVPEDSASSELVARIDHQDPEWIMPPPDSHKSLTETEKDLLRRWIDEGAPYTKHWSFTPIDRPELPANGPEGSETAIDAFVSEKLKPIGAKMSPRAKADRLVRRLYLDLIGLPPTPRQVETFVQDAESDFAPAVERLLDELFSSIHHGERMASFWLDVVRYSDTVGYHGDQNQNVFPYRDWVIDAFNANMPFDEFTRKQLAGDLIPNATTDDLIASGFNRLNMMTREGGAQPGEYLTKYTADRVRTVGMAWMGLTTGCAECHDHKFDPFTAKDFYSLGAFFADLKQWGVYSDYGYTPNPDLKGFRNDFPFPPEIEIVSDALVREQRELRNRLVELARGSIAGLDEKQTNDANRWWEQLRFWLAESPTGWQFVPTKESAVAKGKGVQQARRRFQVNAASLELANQSTLKVNELRMRFSAPTDAKTRTLKVELFIEAEGQAKPIRIESAQANRWLPDFAGGVVQDDVSRQWKFPAVDAKGQAVGVGQFQYYIDQSSFSGEPTQAVFKLREPLSLSSDQSLRIEVIGGDGLDVDWHVSPVTRLRPLDPTEMENLATSNDLSSGAASLAYYLTHGKQFASAGEAKQLVTQYHQCRDGRTYAMVSQATEPFGMRVLPRGNWQDDSGEPVQPAVPEFLASVTEADGKARLTRMDLAEWIVSSENPLTARVVVNRLWKQFFGSGITEAADDLGAQGDPPSHPRLLDYLASELIESDWNLRHVMRLIVSSRTYQQDSKVREQFREVDPENRLLSYHPARRLEAEAIRDNALSIAGLLNYQVGGPPIRPYQPAGYYSNLQFPNRTYQSNADDDQYRRGLYMHWQRTFLHPMLANFDAPSREDCVAIRANANTPQQALTLLNDPTFIEAAGAFAWNTLIEYASLNDASLNDETKLRAMIRKAVQREAVTDEVDRLLAFLDQQRGVFAANPELIAPLAEIGLANQNRDWSRLETLGSPETQGGQDAQSAKAEWAAWTATARVLLNLHETITRY